MTFVLFSSWEGAVSLGFLHVPYRHACMKPQVIYCGSQEIVTASFKATAPLQCALGWRVPAVIDASSGGVWLRHPAMPG